MNGNLMMEQSLPTIDSPELPDRQPSVVCRAPGRFPEGAFSVAAVLQKTDD